jgi:hypothetical protein
VKNGGVHMLEPFHLITTLDENVYSVTMPEKPNVSVRCVDVADIIPTATTAKEQDEQSREKKTAVCPRCGLTYSGYPAVSRADNETEICPDCGTIETLDAVGMSEEGKEKILQGIREDRENTVIDLFPAASRIASNHPYNPRIHRHGLYHTKLPCSV